MPFSPATDGKANETTFTPKMNLYVILIIYNLRYGMVCVVWYGVTVVWFCMDGMVWCGMIWYGIFIFIFTDFAI